MEGIKVSVIVAVYNSQQFLRQALDSIRRQSLKEIEIILVDDGSTDSSPEIIKEYAKMDDRVRIFFNEESSEGAAAARNLGIRNARGKYIAILDSDDFFETDMLEKMTAKAEETDAEIVLCDAFFYWDGIERDTEPNGIFIRKYFPESGICSPLDISERLFQLTPGYAWNKLFLRELIQREHIKFDSVYFTDDLGFTYLAMACAKCIAAVDDRLVHYRRDHEGSQSANMGERPETGYVASWHLMQQLKVRGIFSEFRKSFCNIALKHAIDFLHRMSSFDSFSKMYNELKNEYFEKLDITGLKAEDIYETAYRQSKDMIMEYSPGDYLVRYYQVRQFSKCLSLSSDIPEGSKISIYGGGKVGREVFAYILMGQRYVVNNWVDKKYASIGFPLNPPESLKSIASDYIVVSVKSQRLFDEIREELLEMGVDKERILWHLSQLRDRGLD